MPTLDYHDAFRKAREWRNADSPAAIAEARDALLRLRADYPDVLEIRIELIDLLRHTDDLHEAIREFHDVVERFPKLDDETLCRGARIHKHLADRAIRRGALESALAELKKAEEYYHRAFECRRWFFAVMNVLTVQLRQAEVCAELERTDPKREPMAQRMLARVRSRARDLLQDPTVWDERVDDDHIWMPASRAEVAFLAGDWDATVAAYKNAEDAAGNHQEYYVQIMQRQYRIISNAYQILGVRPPGDLGDPETFFPSRGATQSASE
jgi:tetratricopeptide (TPR) repeat protein